MKNEMASKELRLAQQKLGYKTQEEFGYAIGVCRATMNRWMRDKHPIDKTAIFYINVLLKQKLVEKVK